MFTNILKTNFIDNIKEHAIKTKITDDRNLFKELFEDIENYARENNIIISDINNLIDIDFDSRVVKDKTEIQPEIQPEIQTNLNLPLNLP